jgi:hypothetical protein
MAGTEFQAGPSQMFVVYTSPDTGSEVDPAAVFEDVAASRATNGWRIVSTAASPTRHSGAFMGREGSGYETKMSVVVVYAKA